MKKTLFVLCGVACLLFSLTSCDFIEWVFGNRTKYSIEGNFDIGDAKNIYIGAESGAKGDSDFFMKITNNNVINVVPFGVDFPMDPGNGLMPYPTDIISLNEDYILVVFGIPVYLVRASDGYGVCLNQIDSKSYPRFFEPGMNEFFLKRRFAVAPNGDVYYQVRSLVGDGNGDNNGIIVRKFSNSTNQLTEEYKKLFNTRTQSFGNGNQDPLDIVLVDERGNIATSFYDEFRPDKYCIAIIKADGSSEVFEIGSPYINAFVGSDGLFHFYSASNQVSFEVKEDGTIVKKESSVPSGMPGEEVVIVSGKNYCLSSLTEIVISEGLITEANRLQIEGLDNVRCYDYSDCFLYFYTENDLEGNKLWKIDPITYSATVVTEDYAIRSFTVSTIGLLIDEIVIDGINETTKEEVIVSLVDSVEAQISNDAGETKDLTRIN